MIQRPAQPLTNCLTAALAVVLLFAAYGALAQDVTIKILVNDDPISDYDIAQRARFLQLTAKEQPGPALNEKTTEMLITEHLQLQEGRKLGITPSEAEVTRVLDGMASQNNLDANGLATALGRAGVGIQTLKNRIGAQMVWQRVVQQKFRREVSVNDAQIDEALAEDSGSSSGGLKQLRLPLPNGANQQTVAAKVAEAENLRAKFRGCGSVQSLASGVQGATIRNLKVQDAATLGSPARILVRNAQVGQMTPPTVSRAGIELYAVCASQSSGSTGGGLDLREETERKIMNEELREKSESYLKEIREKAFVEYR